jgi:hypothetical protein
MKNITLKTNTPVYTPVESLIYEMMTENTGSHMLDSGGAYGRNHERNAKKTIEDFRAEPSARLEVYYNPNFKEDITGGYEFMPTVNIFHKLTDGCLTLDELCHEFNAMEVKDWDSEDFYGVSSEGEKWLQDKGFITTDDLGDTFNTYNYDNVFSQILQGRFIQHEPSDETYLVLQIHGGCDARGGYTDGKLFRVNKQYQEHYIVLDDGCNFWIDVPSDYGKDYVNLDYYSGGDWVNTEGTGVSDEEFKEFGDLAFEVYGNKDNKTDDSSSSVYLDGCIQEY